MDKNEDKNEDKDSLTGAVREGIEQAIDLTIDTIAQVPKVFGGVTGFIGSRFFEPQASRVGQPPGTLAFSGEKKTEEVQILVFDYSEDSIEEKKLDAIEECFEYRDTETITWINIVGLHDVELLEKVGDHFDLHPLVLEDILNTSQRPKIEDYEDYLYVVVKMLSFNSENFQIVSEQISLVLGRNFVLSFQEQPGDTFKSIRDRLRNARGRIRERRADYLAYSLLDSIIDHYFLILEKLGEAIEGMEQTLLERPEPKLLHKLHHMKREMIFLRKSVYPLRELIVSLERVESDLVDKSTNPFIHDLYDHTIQVIDTIETFRDMLSGMFDMYLSSISNRMNTVMQMLSLVATIFIPLTFIAGIYGMNFENMPELKSPYGYQIVIGAMAVIGVTLGLYFRLRKWW